MPLANIVLALIVVGVALWLINRYIPMASSIKTIVNTVVVVTAAAIRGFLRRWADGGRDLLRARAATAGTERAA